MEALVLISTFLFAASAIGGLLAIRSGKKGLYSLTFAGVLGLIVTSLAAPLIRPYDDSRVREQVNVKIDDFLGRAENQ